MQHSSSLPARVSLSGAQQDIWLDQLRVGESQSWPGVVSTPWTLAGLLAILKSEACYVSLDPAHPAERLEYLLHDSAPVAILTQQNQGHGWLALYKP